MDKYNILLNYFKTKNLNDAKIAHELLVKGDFKTINIKYRHVIINKTVYVNVDFGLLEGDIKLLQDIIKNKKPNHYAHQFDVNPDLLDGDYYNFDAFCISYIDMTILDEITLINNAELSAQKHIDFINNQPNCNGAKVANRIIQNYYDNLGK